MDCAPRGGVIVMRHACVVVLLLAGCASVPASQYPARFDYRAGTYSPSVYSPAVAPWVVSRIPAPSIVPVDSDPPARTDDGASFVPAMPHVNTGDCVGMWRICHFW
jgi:hypothetical protein